MTRMMLPGVAKVSQMSDPVHGTGKGNDDCTESVWTMVDYTYLLGPSARSGVDPEIVMREFSVMLNGPQDIGKPQDISVWAPAWLKSHNITDVSLANKIPLTFADCKRILSAGHIAIIQVADYSSLKLFNGGNPYAWNAANDHAGHVLLLAGYDEDFIDGSGKHWGTTLIVHDPLRALSGMPYDYQYQSIKNASAQLIEVVGPSLLPAPVPPPAPPPPAPAPDPRDAQIAQLTKELADAQAQLQTAQGALQSVKAWLSAMPNF